MSNEIRNEIENNAVELSADELDTVNGGFGIVIGDAQNASLGTGSNFEQNILQIGQQTVAGPGGAGTTTVIGAANVESNAFQVFDVFQ